MGVLVHKCRNVRCRTYLLYAYDLSVENASVFYDRIQKLVFHIVLIFFSVFHPRVHSALMSYIDECIWRECILTLIMSLNYNMFSIAYCAV